MKLLYSAEERQKHFIVKVGANFAVIDEMAWKELIDSVLIFINADEARAAAPVMTRQILMENDGTIQKKFLTEQLIEFALNTICEDDGRLSANKVSRFLALSLLIEKHFAVTKSYPGLKLGDEHGLSLGELSILHKNLMEEKVPFELLKDVKPSTQTLFEGLGDDFGYLVSYAVIIPTTTKPEKWDQNVVVYLHKHYNAALAAASTSFESRLAALFEIKPRWTYGELETYLNEWVEPELKLQTLLGRLARTVKDDNPFMAGKQCIYYTKKF